MHGSELGCFYSSSAGHNQLNFYSRVSFLKYIPKKSKQKKNINTLTPPYPSYVLTQLSTRE